MTTLQEAPQVVWYKEPWPWILMSGPAVVIVAGVITLMLASASENALVVDNYYKEGLSINRRLQAEREASAHHYIAHLHIAPNGQLEMELEGDPFSGSGMRVQFVHPTSVRYDREMRLERNLSGIWIGTDARFLKRAPRWSVILTDGAQTWRLNGAWRPAVTPTLTLTAGTP